MGLSRRLSAAAFYRCLRGAVEELAAQRERINRLNVFPVPDGDTGTNMCLTLEAALREVEAVYGPDVSLGRLAEAAAKGSLWGARGNSGVILSQFLRGWADALVRCRAASCQQVVEALERAVATAYRAVMEPVEGTMLSVGKGASEAARAALRPSADVSDILRAALEGARTALEKTPLQLEVLRRAGVVDAGGAGLVAIIEGALKGVAASDATSGSAAEEPALPGLSAGIVAAADAVSAPAVPIPDAQASGLAFKYCTEFVLKGPDLPAALLRRQLAELGDSVLVVGDGEVLKIHLHTNRPGRALEIAVEYGSLSAIQISNMEEQVAERAAREAPVALVAVAPGPGLAEIFKSLGAAETVLGGQTMNPSVQELADAVARVSSPYVIVLPNNRNVLLAARHAASLVPGKHVRVVPSVTVPQGVAAALAFRPVTPSGDVEGVLDGLARDMERAMAAVRSGEVTVATRDYEADGHRARAGDVIGLEGDSLLAVGTDRDEVACRLVEALGGAGAQLITVYYGADVDEAGAQALGARLREAFPAAEVELYAGGQPHYPYLLSVE